MTDTPMDWQLRMRQFQDELHRNDPHSNAMEVFIIDPSDFLAMTFSPDPQNIAVVRSIGQWLKAAAEGNSPPLCATCEHEFADFREAHAFIVGRSLFARDSDHTLISGICPKCVERTPEDLFETYYQGLRDIGLAKNKLAVGTA